MGSAAAEGSACWGGVVDNGEGALREMLFVRRYIPDSWRFKRRRGCDEEGISWAPELV